MQTSSLGAATPGIRDSCICFNTLQVVASPSQLQRQLQLHLQLQIPGPGLSRKTSLGAATVAQKTKLWDSRLIYKRSKGGRADGGQGSGLCQLVPPLWQLTIGDNFSFSRASEQLQVMSKLCIKRRRGRGTTSLCLSLGVGDLTVATDIDMNRRLIDRATNNVQRAGSASAWGFLCHTLTAVSRLTRRPICCFHLCAPFHRHFNVEEDARAQLFAVVVVVVIFPPPDLLLLFLLLLLLLLRRLREH